MLKKYSALIFIASSVILFFYTRTFEINWMHEEMRSKAIYWSIDGLDDYHLHTGVINNDFKKMFITGYVDGVFRLRQVSYFIEMISFKFWQYLGLGFLNNYTLVFLHILNAVLVGRVVFLLTQSKVGAWAAGLLFLNSAIAVATLLFPFRNAKLLVMAFFLLAWNIFLKDNKPFSEWKLSRQTAFLAIILCMVFTDEYAFFLIGFLVLLMLVKYGRERFFCREIYMSFFTLFVISAALTRIFYQTSFFYTRAVLGRFSENASQDYLQDLFFYYQNPAFILDVLRAFFFYFIPRNLGHWDLTLTGFMAFLSFILMAVFFRKKSYRGELTVIFLIAVVLFIKSLVLVHNSGIHKIMMPDDAVFPSLLYFSYYYPYCEAVFLFIIIGLLIKPLKMQSIKTAVLFFLVFIIGFSNAWHLRNGPREALQAHGLDTAEYKNVYENIHYLTGILKQKDLRPVYVSFPNQSREIKTAKWQGPEVMLFSKIIPVMFLRLIEKKQVMISTVISQDGSINDDLSRAATFFDAVTGKMYNLSTKKIPMVSDRKGMGPELIYRIGLKDVQKKRIVFFVKGLADIECEFNEDAIVKKRQTYKYSYQAIELDIPQTMSMGSLQINIRSANKDFLYFYGPYELSDY